MFDDLIIVRAREDPSILSSDFSGLVDIAVATHRELAIQFPSTMTHICEEALVYYSTCAAHLRMLDLRLRTGTQPLNTLELNIMNAIKDQPFHLPVPIVEYLKTHGPIDHRGTRYQPSYPLYPTGILGMLGGFYDPSPVDGNPSGYINLCRYPTPGVTAHAVLLAGSDHPPGQYDSLITYCGLQPTESLLGYRNLSTRSQPAKDLIRRISGSKDHVKV